MKYAIILAAGKGTRMKSKNNKVMHKILNKPMIGHVVDNLEEIDIDQTVVVTGFREESIKNYLGDRVEYATQDEQKGTAHAVSQVSQLKDKSGSTLLLYGDSALISQSTLQKIYKAHGDHDLTIVSAQVKNPGRYARVIRDNQGNIKKIVETRNATELEATSKEINLGVYCFNNELLYKYLPEIEDDSKEELNIIDLVSVMRKNGHKIQAIKIEDASEFMGINDRFELAKASQWMRNKINHYWLEKGVSILDPNNTYIGPDVEIEADVIIEPNSHIYGNSIIMSGVTVTANSYIVNSEIGPNTVIESSKIVDSKVGSDSTIGPFAHLRNHTELGNHVRVGNFVEMKNTKVGNHTATAHLSYLGDAEVGSYVNIGCGVVTINYDGKEKHKTVIGDHSFVGSQSGLVAPVTVGENVLVAAGSMITEDVESDDLAIARQRQSIKKGYGRKYLEEKGKI